MEIFEIGKKVVEKVFCHLAENFCQFLLSKDKKEKVKKCQLAYKKGGGGGGKVVFSMKSNQFLLTYAGHC